MAVKVTAVFCDDVRADDRGTFILVGVYPGLLTLEDNDKSKRIANWIQICGLPNGTHEVGFKIEFKTDEEPETSVLAKHAIEIEVNQDLAVILKPSGLLVPREKGTLTLLISIPGEEEYEIASLQVRISKEKDKRRVFRPRHAVRSKTKSKKQVE